MDVLCASYPYLSDGKLKARKRRIQFSFVVICSQPVSQSDGARPLKSPQWILAAKYGMKERDRERERERERGERARGIYRLCVPLVK